MAFSKQIRDNLLDTDGRTEQSNICDRTESLLPKALLPEIAVHICFIINLKYDK